MLDSSTYFTFGAPVPPRLFYNREVEVKRILARVTTIKNGVRNDVALLGPRRVGKSSLLVYLEDKLASSGLVAIKLDCEGHDMISFLKEYGNTLLELELARKGVLGMKERFKKGFTETITALAEALGLKSLEIAFHDFLKLRMEIEKNSALRPLTGEEVRTLFQQTFEMPEKIGQKYVVMFDEFQETRNFSFPGDFYAYFRNLTQNHRNVTYLYTGSAIGMIQEIFGDPENPLAGNVELMYIQPFDKETTAAFLESGFKRQGKHLSAETTYYIYETLGGFPAYLNWMGLKLQELQPQPGEIPRATAEKAYDEMLSFQSPIYQMIERQLVRLGRATKNILRVIAFGHNTPSEISRESKVKNVYVYLSRLEKYGLIYKKNNHVQLIDPVIREYLKRK